MLGRLGGAYGQGPDHRAPAADEVADEVQHAEPPGFGAERRRPFGWPHLTAVLVLCLVAGLGAGVVWWTGRPTYELVGPAAAPAPPPPAVGLDSRSAPSPVPTASIDAALGSDPAGSAEPAAALTVHVTGLVRHPGVVTVPQGARVVDAIGAAGGPRGRADLTLLNLAQPVVDGSQVLVPGPPGGGGRQASGASPLPSTTAGPLPPATTPGEGALVPVNAASAAELEALDGIGPVLAERIVAWREANGPFAAVEELLEVSGIGPVLLEQLRSEVVL